MKTKYFSWMMVAFALALVMLFAWPQRAAAATRAANIPVGTSDPNINDGDSFCSLIEALENANDTTTGQPYVDCTAGDPASGDTITLQAGAVYSLTAIYLADPDGYGPTGLPAISTDVVIDGNSATIVRDTSTKFRLFYVTDTGTLTLDTLTLQNGRAEGFSGGRAAQYGGGNGGASAGLGGAIFNRGEVNIIGSTLLGNVAKGGAGGSGYTGGSSITRGAGGGGMGSVGSIGSGGGINGGASASNDGNGQAGAGGGVGGGGGGGSKGAGHGGNGGFGGGGGGGGAGSTSPIVQAGGNGGFGGGGGGGGNGTSGGDGGFGGGNGGRFADSSGGSQGGFGGAGGGMGGAIFNNEGVVTITNSTLTNNTAQGGNGNSTASRGGGSGSGFGGAIFNLDGTIMLDNTTLALNTVAAGSGGSAGSSGGTDVYTYQSGGTATSTVRNSILAAATSGKNCVNNGGTTTSSTSLIENHTSCGTPLSTADPQFSDLDFYGGTTALFAILPGSPAMGVGNSSTCPSTDQRGFGRVGTCDLGSYEFQGVTVTGTGGDGQSTNVTLAYAQPLTVAVTANHAVEPIAGATYVWSGPTLGASIDPQVVTGIINAQGIATATVAANDSDGAFIVTGEIVNTPDSATAYNLTNIGTTTICADGVGSTASIIAAVESANAAADADVIELGSNCVYTVTAAYASDNGLPSIDTPITLHANGSTIVRDSGSAFRFFEVTATGLLTIENGTLLNGGALFGGAILVDGGTLTLRQSTLADNTEATLGGALALQAGSALIDESFILSNTASNSGGGIYVVDGATLDLQRTSVAFNSAAAGAGLYNSGEATVVNSTFSANSASTEGGGLLNDGAVTVTNSTLATNSASSGAAFVNSSGGDAFVSNSIMGDSVAGSDCEGLGSLSFSVNNIVEDGSCAASIVGDPGLLPLNTIFVHRPTSTSPALDSGSNTYCPATDQLGATRPAKGICDIGAIELSDILVDTSVTDLNDGDGLCSIIEAVANANDQVDGQPYVDCPRGDPVGPDTVILAQELYTLTTVYTDNSGLPAIDSEVTIAGNGATIARDPDAGTNFRLLRVLAAGTLTISDTVLANGITDIGGAIYTQGTVNLYDSALSNNESTSGNLSLGGGGAVMVRDGHLHATNTIFADNIAYRGGAIFDTSGYVTLTLSTLISNTSYSYGGIIYTINSANLTIEQSTIMYNSTDTSGGGLYANGAVHTISDSTWAYNSASFGGAIQFLNGTNRITNSTFTANVATGKGSSPGEGGALSISSGTTTLANVTLSGNQAADGGGIYKSGGTVHLLNSVVANSVSGGDCEGTLDTITNSLIEDGSCDATLTGDPLLLGLANNGGPTWTMLPDAYSPIIDAGDNATCEATDQRGIARPDGDTCDIGAVEHTACPLFLADIADGDTAALISALAIMQSCPELDTVTLAANGTYTFSVADNDEQDIGPTALPWILTTVKVIGNGSTLSRSTSDPLRFFHVVDGGALTLDDLTLMDGLVDTSFGGALLVMPGGKLTILNSLLTGNHSIKTGGVLFADTAEIVIDQSQFVDNSAEADGGALFVTNSQLTISDSLFDGNRSTLSFAGAIESIQNSTTSITGTVFSNNSAVGDAGAIENAQGSSLIITGSTFYSNSNTANGVGGAISNNASTANIVDSTFISNTTPKTGGAISDSGILSVTNSTFDANQAEVGGALYVASNGKLTMHDSVLLGNQASTKGGAINTALNSTTTISHSTFTENSADQTGGAILNGGVLTLSSSTLNGNHSVFGGGIFNNRTMYVTASTLVTNTADLSGGALYNQYYFAVGNSTFSANTANYGGAAYNFDSMYGYHNTFSGNDAATAGAVLYSDGPLLWHNSIIANSTTSAHCAGGTANGVSITNMSDTICGSATPTATLPLGPLQDNGGPTLTHALLAGSDALDAGYSDFCDEPYVNNVDQRGVARPQGAGCDVGAYEAYAYMVGMTTAGNGIGTITLDPPGGVYDYGTVVTASVAVSTGATFAGWSGDLSGTTTPMTLTVDGDKSITATIGLLTYTVGVSVTGAGVGEVTLDPPGGIYDYGAVVTASVAVSTGSTFAGWSGDLGGTTTPLTFTVDGDKSITATVGLLTYTVGVSVTGTGIGEVSLDPSGGVYDYGTIVTAYVGLAYGSTLTGWSGDISGSSTPVSFTVDGDKSITATIDLLTRTVDVRVTGSGVGEVTLDPPGGVYAYGTVVTASVAVSTGSAFTGWSGDLNASATPIPTVAFAMDNDRVITATIELVTYTVGVNVTGSGNGTITLDPPGGLYDYGTVVTASVAVSTGSTFAGWSGDLSGATTPMTFTVDGDKNITTTVGLLTYTVGVSVTGTGIGEVTLDPPGGQYDYGTVVTASVAVSTGATFAGWSGDLSGATTPMTFTVDGDKNITATIDLVTYTVGVSVTGAGVGEVTLDPSGGVYDYGTVVTASVAVSTGATFAGWSGDLSGATTPMTFTVDGDKNITATIDLVTYTVGVSVTGSGVGEVTLDPPGGVYDYGTVVTASVAVSTGSAFAGWSGDLNGLNTPLPLTVDGDKAITATFAVEPIVTHTLTVNTVGNGNVTPASSVYTAGTVISLTATADEGWDFAGWSGDLTGTDSPTTLSMDGDKTITATFTAQPIVTHTLTVNTVGNGSVAPASGIYTAGTSVQLTATADDGWNFAGWSGDLTGTDSPATLSMDGDKTITATFTVQPIVTHTLTVNTVGNGNVTPASGIYTAGTVISLTATADEGWDFSGWSGDASGTDASQTITMDADKVVTATFVEQTTETENTTPNVTAAAAQTATVGISQTVALGSFTDEDDDAPWQVTVAWGDSTSDPVFDVTAPGDLATQVHTYTSAGVYTVSVAVDDGTSVGVASFTVTVGNDTEEPDLTSTVMGIIYFDANSNGSLDDGEGLEGATVALNTVALNTVAIAARQSYTTEATTVADGSFTLPNVPLGTYALTIAADGYETTVTEVEVGATSNTVVEPLALSPTVQGEDSGTVVFLPRISTTDAAAANAQSLAQIEQVQRAWLYLPVTRR